MLGLRRSLSYRYYRNSGFTTVWCSVAFFIARRCYKPTCFKTLGSSENASLAHCMERFTRKGYCELNAAHTFQGSASFLVLVENKST